jgi:hypothetical protein
LSGAVSAWLVNCGRAVGIVAPGGGDARSHMKIRGYRWMQNYLSSPLRRVGMQCAGVNGRGVEMLDDV